MLCFEDFILGSNELLRTALSRMTENNHGILFVCESQEHLVGVLSDGDVRRALLHDQSHLSMPVNKLMQTDPRSAVNEEEARALLRTKRFVGVPVVSEEGRVTAVAIDLGADVEIFRPSMPEPAHGIGSDTIVLIPAGSWSQYESEQNLAVVGGKSLLGWAIAVARDSSISSQIVVATDSKKIAEEALRCGAEVIRRAELLTDKSSTLDVVLHALDWATGVLSPSPSYLILLEPSVPLRKPEHLRQALHALRDSESDCVMSVSEVPHFMHPKKQFRLQAGILVPYSAETAMDKGIPESKQESTFYANGLVYAMRVESVLRNRSLYGSTVIPLVTSPRYCLNVQTPAEIERAERELSGEHSF